MKSSIGKNIQLSVFGESHGNGIGMVLQGLAPGIGLDFESIHKQLDLRKPKGKISTKRKESDAPIVISGVFEGKTTGTPICIMFENSNTNSKDYNKTKDIMRPSHADYSGHIKYNGYNDYRGGGHFSGRLTTPIVCAGAIAKQILANKGIYIGSHILQMKDIKDICFDENKLEEQIHIANNLYFPVLDEQTRILMEQQIEAIANTGDSIGGILESAVIGLEAGIGEPMFDSLESVLSHYIFSVPAVKGIEFGLGFDFANHTGSEVNDTFYYDDNNHVKTKTNNNGGINGGISNGMPLLIKTVIKPTPSIYKKQESINIQTKKNTTLQIEGRHDPAIIHRARVVVDSMIALALLDIICDRYGYMWMVD